MPACSCCRAPCLHGKQHDVDPVLMHTLTPDKFWPHFKQRYGENKHLVRTAAAAEVLVHCWGNRQAGMKLAAA